MSNWRNPGILAALGAAFLFGAGTPLAKILLDTVGPWLLAGILYLGSGLGLAALWLARPERKVALSRRDAGWLLGAVLAGGMTAPVLLMWGLSQTPAAAASLLLNAEGVLTAVLAWVVFRENVDRRVALGMACIVAGAVVLSWSAPASKTDVSLLPAAAIVGACLAWAIDNNLTRKVSLADATFIAMVKGLVAGLSNVGLAVFVESKVPTITPMLAGAVLGFLSYGVSLVLFVIALRHLGAARTGAYFSTAPFVGAAVAVIFMGDPMTLSLATAGLLMGAGVWLHVTERHRHLHTHESMEHAHEHVHDEHHQHPHSEYVAPGTRHSHRHRHEPMTHEHAHYPDMHHRHDH